MEEFKRVKSLTTYIVIQKVFKNLTEKDGKLDGKGQPDFC